MSPGSVSLDPLDTAEAYRTFRKARLLLFCLLLIGLIVTQSVFWIVDRGGIDCLLEAGNVVFVDGRSNDGSIAFTPFNRELLIDNGGTFALFREVAEEPDAGVISVNTMNTIISDGLLVTNYVLFLSAILYCLMLLVTLHLTMIGRMGGLTAAGKAFILSLMVLILLVPWQLVFGIFHGTLYTYSELIERYQVQKGVSLGDWDSICYYIRFSGLWLLTFTFLILAQLKSSKSKKQIQAQLIPSTPKAEPVSSPFAAPPPPAAAPPTIAVSDSEDTKQDSPSSSQ